jgi:hypothetical protein
MRLHSRPTLPTHPHLTLRSGPQDRVSKGGHAHLACCPSFETLAALAPQDEVEVVAPVED